MQPDIYKREILNSTIEIAAAKAHTKRYPLLEKDNIVLQILWAKSLFQRMGFVRCKVCTGKVTILVGNKKDVELKFIHKIVINFDQTPSKCIQVSSNTMEKKGDVNVPISGIDLKRSITVTFSITSDGKFFLRN